jgi:hypothetical protein
MGIIVNLGDILDPIQNRKAKEYFKRIFDGQCDGPFWYGALKVLKDSKDRQIIPALETLYKFEEDEQVRKNIVEILCAFGGAQVVEPLLAVLQNEAEHGPTRRQAIYGLVATGQTDRIFPVFFSLLAQKPEKYACDYHVRGDIVEAIGNMIDAATPIESDAALAVLQRLSWRKSEEHPYVESRIGIAILAVAAAQRAPHKARPATSKSQKPAGFITWLRRQPPSGRPKPP